jgi:hypothetical protein
MELKPQASLKMLTKNQCAPSIFWWTGWGSFLQIELAHLHCEVRVMKLLRHPNVIRLYQVRLHPQLPTSVCVSRLFSKWEKNRLRASNVGF